MCEFKVKKIKNGKEIEIVDNVLYSTIQDNKLIFRNILGMTTTVENALITEISVPSERIALMESPILPHFYGLMQLINEQATKEDIKKAWIEFKEKGDKVLGI